MYVLSVKGTENIFSSMYASMNNKHFVICRRGKTNVNVFQQKTLKMTIYSKQKMTNKAHK